jgi:Tfp pilus assembly protein PilN
MTQLNLLPDVKLEYLRSTRQKRLVVGISLLVAAASLAIVLLLALIAFGIQKKNLSDLNGDIELYTSQLKNTPELEKVLTIQNQLNALPGLHEQKPVVSRLFGYLTQVTPNAASISKIEVNYDEQLMSINGTARTLDVANTFIDTLKFTTFTSNEDSDNSGSAPKAFSEVVMSEFTRNSSGANYKITLKFDAAIFDDANTVKLSVPNIVSTRSATERPTELFQATQPDKEN